MGDTTAIPSSRSPRRPLIVIWCCETFKQFKILRSQLEAECFDRPWTFNKVDHTYSFTGGQIPGSQMFLVSGDSSWTHIQGINPDLVIFDEEPPEALWNEMKMRRRGLRKTRYVFAATATQGMTWMHRDLYLPWLQHHAEAGPDRDRRRWTSRRHPRLWVWARGGINDNPGADAGDRDWYASQTFNSDAERQVRLGGGFADFTGTPVFDLRALEIQKPNLLDGQAGHFAYVPCVNADDPRSIVKVENGQSRALLLAWTDGGGDGRGPCDDLPAAGARPQVRHRPRQRLRAGHRRLRRGRGARPRDRRAGGRGRGALGRCAVGRGPVGAGAGTTTMPSCWASDRWA